MIPRVFHFIFGLAENFDGKPFSFIHYMAVKSALARNPEFSANFYCKFEPSGMFWDVAKRYLNVIQIEPPSEIFGNKLFHVAHVSDVIRLQRLEEEGGIYLDLDTITAKSYEPLLNHSTVLGIEGTGERIRGLCNAVILAEKGAPFIKRWLESYRTFRSTGRDLYWNEHSVGIPWRLATENPNELTVLDRGAFFYPDWKDAGIRDLFLENKRFPAAYCHHLWETYAWHLIKQLDDRVVRTVDTSYNVLARQYLGDDTESFEDARASELKRLMQSPIRLNLGCGAKKEPGWLNVDAVPENFPDLTWDMTRRPWPLSDNSVGEVRVSDVVGRLGEQLSVVFQELYRVCMNDARITVNIPHPRHDKFLSDPTYKRALLPESFEMLDRDKCRQWQIRGELKSPLAIYWNVDFKLEHIQYAPDRVVMRSGSLAGAFAELLPLRARNLLFKMNEKTPRFLRSKSSGLTDDAGFSRHMNNIFSEIQVVLRAQKHTSSNGTAANCGAAPGSEPIDIRSLGPQR